MRVSIVEVAEQKRNASHLVTIPTAQNITMCDGKWQDLWGSRYNGPTGHLQHCSRGTSLAAVGSRFHPLGWTNSTQRCTITSRHICLRPLRHSIFLPRIKKLLLVHLVLSIILRDGCIDCFQPLASQQQKYQVRRQEFATVFSFSPVQSPATLPTNLQSTGRYSWAIYLRPWRSV